MDVRAMAQAEHPDTAAPAKNTEIAQSGEVACVLLAALFEAGDGKNTADIRNSTGFARSRQKTGYGEVLLDRFESTGAECAALRSSVFDGGTLTIGVLGGYKLQTSAAGGWLLSPLVDDLVFYWIPQPPMLRRLDKAGHILSHRKADIACFDISTSGLEIRLELLSGYALDLVVWRLPAAETDLLSSLKKLNSLESQRYFLLSSHTAYSRPADLYLHLVHGDIYENHEVWPKYWRICSELDAYSLYVTLNGLERATGKCLYTLLKIQVVHSVIARQAKDGGWYHGEWTGAMESHYRLVNAAILMLAAYLEQHKDKTARKSLEKAAAFIAARAHRLDVGAWFMHDSLEADAQSMREYPFAWSTSTALGKEVTNMLILNTHLDSSVALDRYAEATQDSQYQSLVGSAKDSAMAVLMLRPCEWLYRLIFEILDLTLLPKQAAERLPLPKRMIKRIGWKYIAPSLHRLKALFPRLVMPNGFIDRSLCQKGFSTRYQSVHVWDLVRYIRRFPDDDIASVLKLALEYTYCGNMRDHWRESAERQDAFGFWIEALYHLCLIDSEPKLRRWLAEAVIDAEALDLGLPPSVLGTNSEAIRLEEQRPCPVPADRGLRVINLSHGEHAEYVVVNCTNQSLQLKWEISPHKTIIWTKQDELPLTCNIFPPMINHHAWVTGISQAQGTSLHE
jgi:hypothetical protein